MFPHVHHFIPGKANLAILVFAASVSLLFAGQHPARGLQASPEIEKNIKEYQSELEFAEKKLASVDSQIKTAPFEKKKRLEEEKEACKYRIGEIKHKLGVWKKESPSGVSGYSTSTGSNTDDFPEGPIDDACSGTPNKL